MCKRPHRPHGRRRASRETPPGKHLVPPNPDVQDAWAELRSSILCSDACARLFTVVQVPQADPTSDAPEPPGPRMLRSGGGEAGAAPGRPCRRSGLQDALGWSRASQGSAAFSVQENPDLGLRTSLQPSREGARRWAQQPRRQRRCWWRRDFNPREATASTANGQARVDGVSFQMTGSTAGDACSKQGAAREGNPRVV